MNGSAAGPRKTSPLAITAFVLACLFFLPLIPLVGSILGIIALVRLADRPHLGGKGLAIAAIPVGLVVVLFLQGIMAAIAIPSFIKYTRKAKAFEAKESLDKIAVGARHYTMTDQYDDDGTKLPSQFPRGETGWTPAQPCCEGESARCAPDPAGWQNPAWKTLHFQLADPHYFQYRYVGGGNRFVAEARGDLDCDGTFSNYRIEGTLGPGGVEVQGPIIENEVE